MTSIVPRWEWRTFGPDLSRLDTVPAPDTLIGMGGAVSNMAAVSRGMTHYDPNLIQGTVLTADEIERQITLYAQSSSAERRAIPGLQPGRADVILAGALIVRTLMGKLQQDRLLLSDRGLRHGVLIDRFS